MGNCLFMAWNLTTLILSNAEFVTCSLLKGRLFQVWYHKLIFILFAMGTNRNKGGFTWILGKYFSHWGFARETESPCLEIPVAAWT